MYGEANFNQNVYKWVKLFKDGWNCIQDEEKLGRLTRTSASEMGDSVNALILADRRVTIVEISEQLEFCVGRTRKIVHDDFSGQLSLGSQNVDANAQGLIRTLEISSLFVWEQLAHPPHSPDLTTTDFLKIFLRATKFSCDDEV